MNTGGNMQRIVSIFFTLVESGYLHCTTQIVNLDDDAGFQTRIINIFLSNCDMVDKNLVSDL